MTIVGTPSIHPNGTTFEYVIPYTIHYIGRKLIRVRDKIGSRGVRITYPSGKKVFKSNKEYDEQYPTKKRKR